MRRSVLVPFALTAACGGAPSPPASARADARPSPPPPAGSAAVESPVASPKDAKATTDAYDDPGEHDPATLTPVFDKAKPPAFPKPTIGERDCWQTIALTGEAQKDFDALVAKCGTPTGAVEYVKPNAGKLHSTRDKRDTYVVRIQGGLCYRFFGVADGTIKDLDILIEKTNGDLVGDDKTNGSVAIIESDKAWCMDRDGDYQFGVQIHGTGTGQYVFGVWARPKK